MYREISKNQRYVYAIKFFNFSLFCESFNRDNCFPMLDDTFWSVTSKIYRKCRFLSFLNRKLNASKRKLKYQLVGLAWEINAPVENVYTSWRRIQENCLPRWIWDARLLFYQFIGFNILYIFRNVASIIVHYRWILIREK